jgi:hypothetical protein
MSIYALPFLARDAQSAWSRSMDLRDTIYDSVEKTCGRLNVEALVFKSRDFEYPAWVSLEAWLPAGAHGAAYRRFCTFLIDPKPHAKYEFELRIECTRDGVKKTYGPFSPQGASTVSDWASYMIDQGPRPSASASRIRISPLQFWYLENKVEGLNRDFLRVAIGVSFAVGLLGVGYSINNQDDIGGSAGGNFGWIIGLIAFLAAVVCFVGLWRRKKIVLNIGRPLAEPRSLRIVDSWQTVVCDIGSDWEDIRTRLFRRLTEGKTYDITPRLENISYLTPDGKQVRQQLVLTQGRGIVFCHCYPYGKDMYVGWEAYLNFGQWAEKLVAAGFDARLKAPVTINTVTPGTARPTEYDLIDLNGLGEWTHTRVIQVIKHALAERKLDQEIDFKISQRGSRSHLIPQRETEDRPSLFKRLRD